MSQTVQMMVQESFDPEWIQLMMIARDLGITLDEVKEFFAKVTQHISEDGV